MITTERISAWLKEPHQLQEIAPEAIQQLAKDYPFFTPAPYFSLINGGGANDNVASLQQSNPVNPVMLGSLILASKEIPVVIEEITIEITETIVITEEIVVTETKEEPFVSKLKEETISEKPETQHAESAKANEHKRDILDDLSFMQPASSEDYFLQQGIKVSNDIPDFAETPANEQTEEEKALMVVMSFAEWLKHISSKSIKAKEEEADKKALKTMWQQQKLAAAIEEESDEIPEQVFEMAVNSIARKDELVSESFANVYAKQGKFEKAIEMYQKLSLLYPEKNAYFAAKIETLQKEI